MGMTKYQGFYSYLSEMVKIGEITKEEANELNKEAYQLYKDTPMTAEEATQFLPKLTDIKKRGKNVLKKTTDNASYIKQQRIKAIKDELKELKKDNSKAAIARRDTLTGELVDLMNPFSGTVRNQMKNDKAKANKVANGSNTDRYPELKEQIKRGHRNIETNRDRALLKKGYKDIMAQKEKEAEDAALTGKKLSNLEKIEKREAQANRIANEDPNVRRIHSKQKLLKHIEDDRKNINSDSYRRRTIDKAINDDKNPLLRGARNTLKVNKDIANQNQELNKKEADAKALINSDLGKKVTQDDANRNLKYEILKRRAKEGKKLPDWALKNIKESLEILEDLRASMEITEGEYQEMVGEFFIETAGVLPDLELQEIYTEGVKETVKEQIKNIKEGLSKIFTMNKKIVKAEEDKKKEKEEKKEQKKKEKEEKQEKKIKEAVDKLDKFLDKYKQMLNPLSLNINLTPFYNRSQKALEEQQRIIDQMNNEWMMREAERISREQFNQMQMQAMQHQQQMMQQQMMQQQMQMMNMW